MDPKSSIEADRDGGFVGISLFSVLLIDGKVWCRRRIFIRIEGWVVRTWIVHASSATSSNGSHIDDPSTLWHAIN
ncbi:hypothetical protein Ancab_000102 [Ancistrocladus abbreviatus]